MQVIGCDLDGTIADLTHRLHLVDKTVPKAQRDYGMFYNYVEDDPPITHIIEIVEATSTALSMPIAFITGRQDSTYAKTKRWIQLNAPGLYKNMCGLWMRKTGDNRPDDIVKEEILRELQRQKGYYFFAVFEDRQRVVDMWRRNGIPCLQVDEGNF